MKYFGGIAQLTTAIAVDGPDLFTDTILSCRGKFCDDGEGRFVAISILIAIFMAASKIYYDRSQVDRLVFIDKTSQAQNSLGKELYQANCAFCHGDKLQGQPHWDKTYIEGKRPAPPLNASGNIALLSNRELFEITKYGGQPFAPPDYINEMPAFEMLLKDSQIWAILAFLRAEF